MNKTPERRTAPLLLYIAGYGRSGSTILGRLLAQDRNVLNLGEVALAPWILRTLNKPCPCGATMPECPVWASVPPGCVAAEGQVADAKTHGAMIGAIAASHPDVRAIVDSSKSCWGLALRAFRLRSMMIGDVRVVHLARDPRGVLWSQLRDSVRKGQPIPMQTVLGRGLRTAIGWLLANLAAELYGLAHPSGYVRLTYEQLMLTGLPPSLQTFGGSGSLRGRIVEAATGNNHDLGGNRLKRRAGRPIEFDDAWRAALPMPASILVTMLCWPLMLKYAHLTRGSVPA